MNEYVKPLVQKRMDFIENEIKDEEAYQETLEDRLEQSKTKAKALEKEYFELRKTMNTPRQNILQK